MGHHLRSLHHTGFVIPSEHQGYSYWDDDLSENEIAIIIGTYTMYTGKYVYLCGMFLVIL